MVTIIKKVKFRCVTHNKEQSEEVKKALDGLFIFYTSSMRTDKIKNDKYIRSVVFSCNASEDEFNKFVELAEKFKYDINIFIN